MPENPSLRCLIVDDEPLAQQVLSAHIAHVAGLQLIQQCNNAMEAFEALHKHTVDLIFLDVNMPVISGLSFLRSLKEPPAVILTTAYPDYALEGYELDVVDYLLKPISFDRFLKAVGKVSSHLGSKGKEVPQISEIGIGQPSVTAAPAKPVKNYFFVKADGKLVKVNYADIRYIEGMKDYLKIHTTGPVIVTHHTMKAMEEQLPQERFVRVHKSYIISLGAIKAIDGNIIILDQEKAEIPLGSSYKDTLLEIIASSR